MNVMAATGVGLGPAGSYISSITAASKLKGTAAQGTAALNASAQLVAAGVQQKDAAEHMHMSAAQITAAARAESDALLKLIASAGDQTTSATQTENAANTLAAAAKALLTGAGDMQQAAANAKVALSPNNLHATATQGLKNVIARK